jgi:hypothetical protein
LSADVIRLRATEETRPIGRFRARRDRWKDRPLGPASRR